MKNIKRIVHGDIKALLKNFFALVIAIGLCLLPALYAWFNIYSNWDPYGNTDGIMIAVASKDMGYIDSNGESANVGEEILNSLKENSSIHWVVTDSDKAVEGVRSGKYYACVVLSEDFSKCMYDGVLHNLKRPKVFYYENEKKNAVATKITDTAVSNLKNNINEMYISILVSHLFEEESRIVEKDSDDSLLERMEHSLTRLSERIDGYESLIDSLVVADERLVASLDGAKGELDAAKSAANSRSQKLKDASSSDYSSNLVKKDTEVSKSISSAAEQMKKAVDASSDSRKTTYYKRALAYLKDARTNMNRMLDSLNVISSDGTANKTQNSRLIALLQTQVSALDSFIKTLEKNVNADKTSYSNQREAMWLETIEDLENEYDDVLQPLVEHVSDTVSTVQKDAASALSHISEDINVLNEVLSGTQSGVTSINKSLSGVSDTLYGIKDSIETLLNTVGGLSENELLRKLKTFLQGDAKGYGEFFAAPVKIVTEEIYPVENYGSGVAPFYTTLALWVGGIFLVALIKVKPSTQNLIEPKPHELFLGRFVLFFLLGQLQTAIIVWGDLSLLGIQCLHPAKFYLASSVTSLTFMLLIYSLTVAFGDIGKAIVVVIVVMQIAGSSGTYPIEILPEFYQKIYIFFPFPYAINAMREAICGMYEKDFIVYLVQLLLFAFAALMLGLVLRLPFIKVNHFVERRMEDTGMM
ncbi:MAG: YhgE/Pip domain-containing protein [Lachnospira sp.]|nr:YhgE/Pip domain-containing protein [Lachnospira sp.]